MKRMCCMMIVIGVLLGGAMQAAAETYKLGMIPLIGWSHFRVAQVKGFWDKHGINVEPVTYVNPHDNLQAYSQKRHEFSATPMALTVSHRRDGIVPDSICLGILSITDHQKYLIVKKDVLNTSLRGHSVGIFASATDAANLFLLSAYLKTVNTSLTDVRLVLMSPAELEANFIRGRLQAVLTLNRGNTFYEQADGVIAISTRTFYEPHAINMRQSVFEVMPPEDVKKFLRGTIEAIEWMRDPANWEEYKGILKEHVLPEGDLSDEQIRELTRAMKYLDPQTLLMHNQERLPEYFAQLRAFVAAEGVLQGDALSAYTYGNVVHNQLLIEVLQEFVE